MTSSSYEQTFTPERLKFAASGHYADGRVVEGKRFIYPEMAAAGLWTTPTDLAKLAIEVQLAIDGKSNKVLSRDMARLMVTPLITMAPDQNAALGLFLEKGDRYFGHGGQDIGFICQLTAGVSGGNGAVVMTNSDGRSFVLIGEILRAISMEYGWKDYAPEPVEVIALGPDKLKSFEGRFRWSGDDVLVVKVKDGTLMGQVVGGDSFELLPVAAHEFIRRDAEVRYVFSPAGALTVRSPQGDRKVERLGPGVTVPLECFLEKRYDEGAALYRKIRAANDKDPIVAEGRLNFIGYQFMQHKLYDAALALFKLNVEFHPDSWKAYDSLAEAYMTMGDKALAIKNYEKSLELNPKNANGAKNLEKLKGKNPAA